MQRVIFPYSVMFIIIGSNFWGTIPSETTWARVVFAAAMVFAILLFPIYGLIVCCRGELT
jgi:hypothetical protein